MPIEELKTIVGPKGWTTDPDELEPHLNERRKAVTGRTAIMLSPSSTEQVAEIVRTCASHGIGIVPQGGNTGLCGGAIPDQSGEQVLLSLSRLNRVRILADVQAAARNAGRCFPLSLSAEGSCQIGGNLSTNAGGINVIRYGNARDQVLGLEVVLADGRVWNGLRALRKDNAGYDMKQVFLGSEGTLGIITAATLRLYPLPGDSVTALIAIRSADQAAPLLGEFQARLGDSILAFELMSDRCLRLVERHVSGLRRPFDEDYEWVVLTEIAAASGNVVEEALAGAIEKELALDVIVAKSEAEAERLWRMRHSISEAQRPEGACLKHDISVPIGALGPFLEQSKLLIDKMQPEGRLVAFGHVGDGNLHYNVMQPEGADPDAFLRDGQPLTEAIYRLVAELGGSFSAEHGIGVTKKPFLRRYRGEVELDLMRALKKALDPADILNPGKVI
jgi:FAD/FMN-containing dehydrogenase